MGELLQASIGLSDILLPILLLTAWLLLRNRATKLAPDSGLNAVVGRGQPVVLEFFSNT